MNKKKEDVKVAKFYKDQIVTVNDQQGKIIAVWDREKESQIIKIELNK